MGWVVVDGVGGGRWGWVVVHRDGWWWMEVSGGEWGG